MRQQKADGIAAAADQLRRELTTKSKNIRLFSFMQTILSTSLVLMTTNCILSMLLSLYPIRHDETDLLTA